MAEEIGKEDKGKHYDIKAGTGGLVDIEFGVQMFQLVYGYDRLDLHTPTTMEALETLWKTGLVNEKQYNVWRSAYRFFREVENRSQIYQDRSDSRIPRDESRAMPLARRLGYEGAQGAGKFLEEVVQNREDVRSCYEDLVRQLEEKLEKDNA